MVYTVYLKRAGQDEYVNDIEANSADEAVAVVKTAFPEILFEDLYAVPCDDEEVNTDFRRKW